MPDINLKPRPQTDPGPDQFASLAVQARQQDYGLNQTPADPYSGLLSGLATLNPALQQYSQHQQVRDDEAQRLADKAAVDPGKAAGQRIDEDKAMAIAHGADPASFIPEARNPAFREAFLGVTAHRLGISAKSDALAEYDNLNGTPDFNADQWLKQKRQQVLQGINNPQMAAIMGQHMTDFEVNLRADVEKERTQQRQDAINTSLTSIAGDAFTPSMTPQEWADRSNWFKDQAKSIGADYKQSTGVLFQRAVAASYAAGGVPELFTAFTDFKDKDGFTMLERNPALAGQLAQAREHAYTQRDKVVQMDSQEGIANTMKGYDDDLMKNPKAVTWERIVGDMGTHGTFTNGHAAADMWSRAQQAMAQQELAKQGTADFYQGSLGYQPPAIQNKVLSEQLGGVTRAIWDAAAKGDEGTIERLMPLVLQAHSRSGATEPVGELVRLVDGLVATAPAASGPDGRFKAAASMYKALSADPIYRDKYFKDEPSKVLEAYTSGINSGTDPQAAYEAAYSSVSPEAREAAAKRVKDPEVQKVIASKVLKFAAGSTWVPQWLGGNGRPDNVGHLQAAAASEARQYLTSSPDASDKQLSEHLESWSASNFALDSTTQTAIKVPPGLGGPMAAAAFTGYSKELTSKLRSEQLLGDGWQVRYMPSGTEGQYQVDVWNGSASKRIGTVSIEQLEQRERSKRLLSTDEGIELSKVRSALNDGKPLPLVPDSLLAKGLEVGFFGRYSITTGASREEMALRNAMRAQDRHARTGNVPDFQFGTPTVDGIAFIPSKPVKVDQALTAQTALEFAGSPVFSGTGAHMGLAASLVSMGEGVVLQAYQDPAKGAGKNIGMGYNLNANATTVDADLKRAGVPDTAFDGIKDGTLKLTPDQAKRLLQVSLPRYEAQAQAAAEGTQSGLWARMTPTQKAVMVDVAYQVGDPKKFGKAWASLAAGDSAAFADQTKVFYTNQSGDRVEDTRRGNLRANLLAGVDRWNALVSATGRTPTSKLATLPAQPQQ